MTDDTPGSDAGADDRAADGRAADDRAADDPAEVAQAPGMLGDKTVDPDRRARSGSATGAERRSVPYLVPVSSDATDQAPMGSGPADFEYAGAARPAGVPTGPPGRAGSPGPAPGVASAPPEDEADLRPGDPGGDRPDEQSEREDWAWVQEWRAGQEPTPWATGIALAMFSALVVGVAVWVLSAGLVDRPVVAILVNLLVAAGLTPAIWLSRNLPVLRWIAAGAASGIVIGWISAVLMLPYPAP